VTKKFFNLRVRGYDLVPAAGVGFLGIVVPAFIMLRKGVNKGLKVVENGDPSSRWPLKGSYQ